MGQLQIPGTSVQYSNPKQMDQSANLDPTTGKPWVNGTDIYPYTGSFSGVVFSPGHFGQTMTNGGSPQPGTFDPTPPKANPVLFNKQPPSLSDGGTKIPNSSVVFKSPA